MRLPIIVITALFALPVYAQGIATLPEQPGQPDTSLIVEGSYQVDPAHTQIIWSVNHLGVTMLSGMFGASGGSLTIDPADPAAAALDVTVGIETLGVSFQPFAEHLLSADFFEVAAHPEARFVSTSIEEGADGSATITGDLTIKGVTQEVTIAGEFVGAGINPMDQQLHIGFSGTASILRSDFDLGAYAPGVSDEVDLVLNAAFFKQP